MTSPAGPTPETLARLKSVVGRKGFIEAAADKAPFLTEWRDRFRGATPLVLRPASVDEVSAILAICHETRTAIVPQGGNTGLVGGQIPFGHEVLLSLTRLSAIREVDALNHTMTAEAGVILADLQAAAEAADRQFPLSLAAEGSCTLGGVLSTNAGGTNVLRYGNARDQTLGLEVVLADGRVWNGLSRLRKDNTGLDLKDLFIGAEGTLGIITAAVVKLFPYPRARAAAFVAVSDVHAAVALLSLARDVSGDRVSGFELIPRLALDFTARHLNLKAPLDDPGPWCVLMEVEDGRDAGLEEMLLGFLETGIERGWVRDGTLARSDQQRQAFWQIRHSLSEVQKFEGASIKNDISVPVSRMPDFIDRAAAAVTAACPGIRPVPFGHIGDGNVHFNLSQPEDMDKADYLARWADITRLVQDIAHDLGGSISAEHGIGRMKRDELPRYKGTVAMEMMAGIKTTLDPLGILNPGKLL